MAITYGMSVKEFWKDNPDLFWAYRFSYYERLKEKQEIFNQNAWLQGAYFYEGISIAIGNSFGKSHQKYPEKPYGYEDIPKNKEEIIKHQVADIKARIKQVNAINSSTTIKEKGGDKLNE